ncbi:hypothetical protein [Nesterenkonia alba]|uniref:hypothetical protein n=1 Tax=Nesterenkonia alba TaxID=515814 RepID=UPI0003B448B0|nr:hypothetical protein [Nesterenkonia alba]
MNQRTAKTTTLAAVGIAALTLTATAAPASAGTTTADSSGGWEDFIEQILAELDSARGGDSSEGDEDEGDNQDRDSRDEDDDEDSDDDGDTWSVDEPLEADELLDAVLDDDELPDGWEFTEGPGIANEQEDTFSKNLELTGFDASDECTEAIEVIDTYEETSGAGVYYTAENGEETYSFFLLNTPEELDMFSDYYADVVDHCGTVSNPVADITFDEAEVGEGIMASLTSDYEGTEWFGMGGQSYGHNHLFGVGDGSDEPDEVYELIEAQLEKFEDAVR